MSEAPTPNQVPANIVIKLPKPAFVIIESPDGEHSHREDAFSVLRMLLEAEKQASESNRWEKVKKWISEKLKISIEDDVAENMALLLHNQVVDFTNALKQEMSKDVFTIASSAQPIQESQKTSQIGQLN